MPSQFTRSVTASPFLHRDEQQVVRYRDLGQTDPREAEARAFVALEMYWYRHFGRGLLTGFMQCVGDWGRRLLGA
jgi:hypothetical protein